MSQNNAELQKWCAKSGTNTTALVREVSSRDVSWNVPDFGAFWWS